MAEYTIADIEEMIDDIEARRGDWMVAVELLGQVALHAVEDNGGVLVV